MIFFALFFDSPVKIQKKKKKTTVGCLRVKKGRKEISSPNVQTKYKISRNEKRPTFIHVQFTKCPGLDRLFCSITKFGTFGMIPHNFRQLIGNFETAHTQQQNSRNNGKKETATNSSHEFFF